MPKDTKTKKQATSKNRKPKGKKTKPSGSIKQKKATARPTVQGLKAQVKPREYRF